ncbi:MAG: class I SAM-dependent methyltransferase [Anaerolineae bacterium]|nr:MAG: class I SAM-dependent methyltransferase [Anaerolineae bacterium]
MNVDQVKGFVLDLGGGSAGFFAAVYHKPDRIILLDVDFNLVREAKQRYPVLHFIVADGERLPVASSSMGMTVCNSVIEHVDDPDALAVEIRRVSQSYFLQTPNENFPLEMHSFVAIPFYHLIPWMWLRRFVCKIVGADYEYVSGVRYLSEQRLKQLFPEAAIAYEIFLSWKKSFYIYCSATNLR